QNSVFLCSTKDSALIDDFSEDEEFSDLLSGETGRPGLPSSIGGTTRRIGPVNRQMSDVSAISPRRMVKGRSPSAPSLGGRKLKRMDSTATTLSQTSNNTSSTSSIRGSINAHGLEEKAPPRLPKSLNQSQMQRYLNKGKEDSSYNSSSQADGYSIRSAESRASFNASQSSDSPSSSSMGIRPESVVSRQSRVVTVKSKSSVSSIGTDRRSVSSLPPVIRPESETSIQQEESSELPSFVHSLVWKVTDFVFIGNESVSTNAHVLCRLNISATVELFDGADLEDKRTFDNTCFCEKRNHARSAYKIKVPETEISANAMAKEAAKGNAEPYNLSDMIRVFCDIVEKEVASQRRVLVFSTRARNRAPAFCVGYIMKMHGINRRAAEAIVQQQCETMRPKVHIEQYLIRALLQWQM
ncbi:hypothetical protein PMAYCL1PPCAC_07346, partial [Pristionchus mayeri]